MHITIILEFFEKHKCPGIAFFLQSSRYVSNEQPCLKATGLSDDLSLLSSLFHFFHFIVSALILFSLYFPISPSLLFFFDVLSQAFTECCRKAFVYIYIYRERERERMCNIYFRKPMNFCLIKKFMTFWSHWLDLVMNRMQDFYF